MELEVLQLRIKELENENRHLDKELEVLSEKMEYFRSRLIECEEREIKRN